MKSFVSWAVLLIAMMLAPSAGADLVGLRVFREEPGGSGQAPSGPPRWIYRVYAEFSEQDDSVLGWGIGTVEFGFGSILNVTEQNSPGNGFTNVPNLHTSDTAPFAPGTFADWDTYMTIGLLYGIQGPDFKDVASPWTNTPLFITSGATSWTGEGGVILEGENFSQGRADYRVSGNDTATRVLLMQLVVNAGEHVRGEIGVAWVDSHARLTFSPSLTFNSVPSPAAGWLFLLPVLRTLRGHRSVLIK